MAENTIKDAILKVYKRNKENNKSLTWTKIAREIDVDPIYLERWRNQGNNSSLITNKLLKYFNLRIVEIIE